MESWRAPGKPELEPPGAAKGLMTPFANESFNARGAVFSVVPILPDWAVGVLRVVTVPPLAPLAAGWAPRLTQTVITAGLARCCGPGRYGNAED